MGISNGFQALIKLGLVPFGEIRDMDENCPTLTFNAIGRHQSRYVTTSVVSANSPWLLKCKPGDLHTVAISHGEGRFTAPGDVIERLIEKGQVATQYTDRQGRPSMDIEINPNGSLYAVEGIPARTEGFWENGTSRAEWKICGEKYRRQYLPADF